MTSTINALIQVLTFFIVFTATLMATRAFGSYLAVRRRLGDGSAVARTPASASVLKRETVDNRFLRWVQEATSLNQGDDASKLKRDLSLAGFNQAAAPVWYVIIRFSLAIGLPILLIFGSALAGRPLTGLGAVVLPLMLCGLGLVVPRAVIDRRASDRRSDLEHEFPDALDLLVVCVEAGLGLEGAFVRVGEEVRESHPRVSEEFRRLSEEIGAGRGRSDALRALADRVDVDAVKSFVALLIQTDALGVSIGQSLRTYAAEMRETRFMKAEEKAMRIPVLMTLPLVACFMPVIVVALLLPAAIDVIRILMPALVGR
ncbi:type II secretion system F family protein [Phenylobacterium sp.]|uniref:type II secretion system F family protein n=1 Tax=Phenylobacterium sp. TaxID=1871053 RepID=UPI0035B016BD